MSTDHNPTTPLSYSEFYSREKRIIIPLTNYHPFHKVSDIDNENPNFIERSGTTERLKNWLSDSANNYAGSYLITGYRGMGKSSFVGKVACALMDEARDSELWILRSRPKISKIIHNISFIICFLLVALFPWNCCFPELKPYFLILPLLALIQVSFFLKIHPRPKPKPYLHYIKINIGNEIRNERDILAILSTSISDKVKKYVNRKIEFRSKYFLYYSVQILFFSTGMRLLSEGFDEMIVPLFQQFGKAADQGFLTTLLTAIRKVLFEGDQWWVKFIRYLLSVFISYALCFKLLEPSIIGIVHRFASDFEDPGSILKRLDSLIDRIDCSVDENIKSDVPASSIFSFNLGAHKSKRHQPASVREIEYELSQIINDLQQSKILNNRFIIVLDELDKLDTSAAECDQKDSKDDSPSFSYEEISSDSDVTASDRQHHILMFLSRLKYFTTNAKAKFVFIAGHELYDAYLADVSDREYAISSMFNGVLNLDSFLSSKPQYKDITRMAESYLCKALVDLRHLQNDDAEREKKVKELEEKVIELNGKELLESEEKKRLLRRDIKRIEEKINRLQKTATNGSDDAVYVLQNVVEEFQTTYCDYCRSYTNEQWETVIHLLKQFISYLTLTSNGAPKRMVNQIEKYVISKAQYDKLYDHADKVGDFVFFFGEKGHKETIKNTQYFLSFGYYERELIGFIHYIAQPIFSSIINDNSDYGDKLLVTSLFLVSHLYKHHASGFSWRNLEYIPELIQSNKTPELRGYIKDILLIMEKMDLTSITSGIYSFKFSKSLIEEISHFSRKFEEVSAIFNFSLDYFRSVKKYYRNLLSLYSNTEHQQTFSQEVVANIYSYLGDIQMAEEEYTEAASTFRVAADLFKNAISGAIGEEKSNNDISLLIVRYTYAMLKLGLAYEKRNTFDSAYLVYNSLTNSLIGLRHIDDNIFGLLTGITYNRIEGGFEVNKVFMYEPDGKQKDIGGREQLLPDYKDDTETGSLKTWVYGDELFSNLYFYLTPQKEQILSKLTAYEDLRIAYLSILAKLFSLEKQNMSGISRENVELAVAEFEYMYIITKMSSKYILAADFYRKLGDILYYKNQNYYKKTSWDNIFLVLANGINVKHLLLAYMFANGENKSFIKDVMKWFTKDPVSIDYLETNRDQKCYEIFIGELKNRINIDKEHSLFEPLSKNVHINKINIKCLRRCMADKGNDNDLGEIIQRPCVACRYYNKSLHTLYEHIKTISGHDDDDDYKKSQTLYFLKLDNRTITSFRANELRQIALTLEAMGNTMLSCASRPDNDDKYNDVVNLELISDILNQIEQYPITVSPTNTGKLSNLDRAILYNITAYRYYEKAYEYTSMTECLDKVMQILIKYFSISKKSISAGEDVIGELKKTLSHTIKLIYETKNYNLVDINKSKQVVHPFEGKEDRYIMLGLTSMMAEIEELIYDYYELELLLISAENSAEDMYNKRLSLIKHLYSAPSLRCYSSLSLASNRINEYFFKAKLNDFVFRSAFDWSAFDWVGSGWSSFCGGIVSITRFSEDVTTFLKTERTKDIDDRILLKVFLIADSIFCLTSAISVLSTIRSNTLFSNISYTETYLKLIEWVKRKEEFELANKEEVREYLRGQIKLLIPDTSVETLKKSFYLHLARSHYHQALQMHTEGSAYQNMIDRFYILDDDLQNNTSQFQLALERYSLRTGNYKEDLDKLDGGIERKKDEQKDKRHSYYEISDYIINSDINA